MVNYDTIVDFPVFQVRSIVEPDSMYRVWDLADKPGVAGDPVTYTMAGDPLVTALLIFCFIIASIAVAGSGRFLARQFQSLFRSERPGTTEMTETSGELRMQIFLVLQTCLLFAIIFFFYSRTFAGEAFSSGHYQTLGILTGTFVIYFIIKACLYYVVDWVFFDSKKNTQWLKSFLFLTSSEGILLFPAVLLLTYFHLSIDAVVVCAVVVVIISKLLAFYKTYNIFFKRNVAVLQNFLYFCTLEVIPLGILWGILTMMDNFFKQIF